MTTNRPSVDSSSRPVNAMMTGRTKRSERTRIAPAMRKPSDPTLLNWRIGAVSGPNGKGCGTGDAEQQEDDEDDERVHHRLDDEPPHPVLLSRCVVALRHGSASGVRQGRRRRAPT